MLLLFLGDWLTLTAAKGSFENPIDEPNAEESEWSASSAINSGAMRALVLVRLMAVPTKLKLASIEREWNCVHEVS